jgi:hypothetical protein
MVSRLLFCSCCRRVGLAYWLRAPMILPPPSMLVVVPDVSLALLHNGMFPQGGAGPSKNGLFIEVFPSDIIAFPGAIKTAHDEWKR